MTYRFNLTATHKYYEKASIEIDADNLEKAQEILNEYTIEDFADLDWEIFDGEGIQDVEVCDYEELQEELQEDLQGGQLQGQGNFNNAPEAEERKEIREGDILESKYSYGGECQLFDFYKVLKVSPTMVTLQMLKKKRTYFPEADGCIYYDTPCVVEPTNEPEDVPTIRRKIKTYRSGRQYVKPQDYYTATIWEGRPKETYNLH